jgi:hypothetical protein
MKLAKKLAQKVGAIIDSYQCVAIDEKFVEMGARCAFMVDADYSKNNGHERL